jgi:hypothetical protein
MRLFFESMAVSSQQSLKTTTEDPFLVLDSDMAGQRTLLEQAIRQKYISFIHPFTSLERNPLTGLGTKRLN